MNPIFKALLNNHFGTCQNGTCQISTCQNVYLANK